MQPAGLLQWDGGGIGPDPLGPWENNDFDVKGMISLKFFQRFVISRHVPQGQVTLRSLYEVNLIEGVTLK